MQIIILIVGIGLGIYGHSWVTEKFPDTRQITVQLKLKVLKVLELRSIK